MAKYHVAESIDDYADCHTLMRKLGMTEQELGFPTIMARKGGELVGFMATTPRSDMVLAGPLVLDREKVRLWTGMRLISLYDNFLTGIGISSYIFWIDEDESGLTRGIRKYFPELQPYAMRDSKAFYVRKLEDGRRQHESTSTYS